MEQVPVFRKPQVGVVVLQVLTIEKVKIVLLQGGLHPLVEEVHALGVLFPELEGHVDHHGALKSAQNLVDVADGLQVELVHHHATPRVDGHEPLRFQLKEGIP